MKWYIIIIIAMIAAAAAAIAITDRVNRVNTAQQILNSGDNDHEALGSTGVPLLPLLSLSEIIEDKQQLPRRCISILDLNASQSEIEKLDSELNLTGEDGLYLVGYCIGLKINEGVINATNGTLPLK